MLKLVCVYMSTSVTWILSSDMKDLSFLQEKNSKDYFVQNIQYMLCGEMAFIF